MWHWVIAGIYYSVALNNNLGNLVFVIVVIVILIVIVVVIVVVIVFVIVSYLSECKGGGE